MSGAGFYHFSVDDVFRALVEVSDGGGPIFEHPFFAFLQQAHRRYGTLTDLYLFERGEVGGRERTLRDVSGRLRAGFSATPWLRFGPHARADALPPFQQEPAEQVETFREIYAQIDRFAGADRRSAWVRLHYFSEAYEAAPALAEAGATTLLLTDKDAGAYHLPPEQVAELKARGRIRHPALELARSHFRVENLLEEDPARLGERLMAPLAQHGYLSLFTHEYELARPEVRARALECLEQLSRRGVPSR